MTLQDPPGMRRRQRDCEMKLREVTERLYEMGKVDYADELRVWLDEGHRPEPALTTFCGANCGSTICALPAGHDGEHGRRNAARAGDRALIDTVTHEPPPQGDASRPFEESVQAAVIKDVASMSTIGSLSLTGGEMLVAAIRERAEAGKERYGTYLFTHNGRNALRDALQEALDLPIYLFQAILEERYAIGLEAKLGIADFPRDKEERLRRESRLVGMYHRALSVADYLLHPEGYP